MLICQISDTHFMTDGRKLARRFDTAAAFEKLMQAVSNLPTKPDLLLFSGDIGERATREEYAEVGRALRELDIPVMAVPGNHDARETLRDEMSDMVGRAEADHLCLMRRYGDLGIVGLDTLVEGAPHGELCETRLAWLDRTLTEFADLPVLLFMHHPPIETGLWAMDRMGLLQGGPELAALLQRHGKVQALLCGHMHRAIQGIFAGIPVRVSPSPSHQIAFDLRTEQPYRLTAEPGQFMMHHWTGSQLLSFTVAIEGTI